MDYKNHQSLTSFEDIEPLIASVRTQIQKPASGQCRLEEGSPFTVTLTQDQKRMYSDLGYIVEDNGTEQILSQKGIAEAFQLTIDFAKQEEQRTMLQGHVLDLRRIVSEHLPAEILDDCARTVSEILGDKSIVSLQQRKSKLERVIAAKFARLEHLDSKMAEARS